MFMIVLYVFAAIGVVTVAVVAAAVVLDGLGWMKPTDQVMREQARSLFGDMGFAVELVREEDPPDDDRARPHVLH